MSDHAEQLTLGIPRERWETAPPPQGTIFLAQRVGAFEHFRPTISVEVAELQPGATLADVDTADFQSFVGSATVSDAA